MIAPPDSEWGVPSPFFDAQIAGIAHSSGGSLATHNVRDFEARDITVIGPWDA